MTASIETITNLRIHSKRIEVGDWTLEKWPNGIIFLEAPNGEGTQLNEDVLQLYLARMFAESF